MSVRVAALAAADHQRWLESVAKGARKRGAERLYWLTQTHNATARALYDKVAKYNDFIRYDYPLPLAVV